uniref:THAP-type domain-containing protein n=1 Tax=Anopheles funestus TaxID=62324 RepID=A0A182RPZ7_ANOFN
MNTYRINANKKCCSYFECGNNSLANPAVTFFAFPKQQDRCEIWIKAAGVPQNVAENRMYRFLCERHFSSIYICRSQRRTLLLANAVPFPFNERDGELEKNEMLEIVEEITEEMLDSDDLPEEFLDDKDSTDDQDAGNTMTIDENTSTLSVANVESINKLVELNTEPSTSRFDYTRKRKHVAAKMAEMKMKLLNTTASPKTLNKEANIKTVKLDGNSVRLVPVQNSKNAQQQTLRLTPVVEKESTVEKAPEEVFRATIKSPVSSSTNALAIIEQNDDTLTSKSSEEMVVEKDDKISEFIFKGEEYVQMPKEHYLMKINRLKRSLAFYENIVRNMREVLDQPDPSSSLDC